MKTTAELRADVGRRFGLNMVESPLGQVSLQDLLDDIDELIRERDELQRKVDDLYADVNGLQEAMEINADGPINAEEVRYLRSRAARLRAILSGRAAGVEP